MKFSPSVIRNALVASALLCALSAQAATLVQSNTGGGKMVLTGNVCPRPGSEILRQAYSYVSSGKALFGCWTLMDGLIHISWDGGQRSVFEVDSFSVQNEPTPAKPIRPSRNL